MHPDELQNTIQRYCNRGVVVDANLLLLYFVGKFDRRRIETFKRTNVYTAEDFDLLAGLLGRFTVLLTTPNILTEVSNLSHQLPDRARARYYHDFRKQLVLLNERYVPSASVRKKRYFDRLGLTDSVIVDLARDRYRVLTDDVVLTVCLTEEGLDVVNFTNIRFADLK